MNSRSFPGLTGSQWTALLIGLVLAAIVYCIIQRRREVNIFRALLAEQYSDIEILIDRGTNVVAKRAGGVPFLIELECKDKEYFLKECPVKMEN